MRGGAQSGVLRGVSEEMTAQYAKGGEREMAGIRSNDEYVGRKDFHPLLVGI